MISGESAGITPTWLRSSRLLYGVQTGQGDVPLTMTISGDSPKIFVALNGQVVNRFHFTGDPQSPRRGLPSTPQEPRFIGLQTHTGVLRFRRIQWKAL